MKVVVLVMVGQSLKPSAIIVLCLTSVSSVHPVWTEEEGGEGGGGEGSDGAGL